MKKSILFVSILVIYIIVPISTYSQGFLKTQNKQIVDGNGHEIILRSMGLGGWMLQEGYMMQTGDFANTQHELKNKISTLIGQDRMEAFYEAWLANHVREIDIDSMAAWGFNSIRLPMHYNLYTLPIEMEPVNGENTWLQKGFDLTDSLLKWCGKNHIYLILDLHAAPGGQGKDQPIADYDPSKPSLWESELNRKKTVALWKKLAEHYSSEEWIGGYDLINETNWDMSGNTPLKNLYKEITDSIRKVDQNHIIFIEGNWFANDFTGLTPPWDNNMVYSFHKYWNFNNQGSIQWMIDIRNDYNIPVWLGESGENSNTWFRECVKLMEDNKIGWSWWPLKKIDAIAGPLSIIKTEGYETLLKYWKGQTAKPSVEYATNALMELAENARLENCIYHPDVIDALFRQQNTSESVPYKNVNIPGTIYAPDFDLGPNGYAYYDKDTANYRLSTGTYINWNRGWSYRNDGVDIEPCSDLNHSNGYNITNTENNEWIQYSVNISRTALYNISIYTSSENSQGTFRIQEDGADICPPTKVNASGGWQNWQYTSVNNVILTQGLHKLRLVIDTGGFNMNGFEFVDVGEISSVPTEAISAVTDNDAYTIHLNINKPLSSNDISSSLTDFKVSINGTEINIISVTANTANSRIVDLKISYMMKARNKILVSYSGNSITSIDGTKLNTFEDMTVLNTLLVRYQIPTKIQAEDFYYNNGLNLEDCSDTGGGVDMGWTDAGDYLDYLVSVQNPGTYSVNYRIASLNTAGQIELQLIGENITSLHLVDLPITGGWQTWTTVSKELHLPAGQHLMRLYIKKSGFNINWFKFDFISGLNPETHGNIDIKVFPNPVKNSLYIIPCSNQQFNYQLLNVSGQQQLSGKIENSINTKNEIDVSFLANGLYLLHINSDKQSTCYKIIVNN